MPVPQQVGRKAPGARLFALLTQQLEAQGLRVHRGTLVHATLVKAQPRPPRRGRPGPDPEVEWATRAKDGHFGYKAHLRLDRGATSSGLWP